MVFFFFQAEDGIRDYKVTGVQTCALPICFAEGWRHWFAAAGIDPEPSATRLEFDSMRLALEMAALGHGVALARSSYAEDLLRTGRVKPLFNVRISASDNVYMTLARGLEGSSPAVQFRDWILAKPVR